MNTVVVDLWWASSSSSANKPGIIKTSQRYGKPPQRITNDAGIRRRALLLQLQLQYSETVALDLWVGRVILRRPDDDASRTSFRDLVVIWRSTRRNCICVRWFISLWGRQWWFYKEMFAPTLRYGKLQNLPELPQREYNERKWRKIGSLWCTFSCSHSWVLLWRLYSRLSS